MARLARLCLSGWPHLVIQRVHAGSRLVLDDVDREAWRAALSAALAGSDCALHAYGVGDDRFALLLTPSTDQGLSRLVQALGRRYVAAYNRHHERIGGLWSGRFRATVLEPDATLIDAMLFVESLAPPAAPAPGDSPWLRSSRPHHLGWRTDPLISDHARFWDLGNTPFDRQATYARLSEQGLTAERIAALEQAAHGGWALGSPAFVDALSASTPRPLLPRKRGRPRKAPGPAN